MKVILRVNQPLTKKGIFLIMIYCLKNEIKKLGKFSFFFQIAAYYFFHQNSKYFTMFLFIYYLKKKNLKNISHPVTYNCFKKKTNFPATFPVQGNLYFNNFKCRIKNVFLRRFLLHLLLCSVF